MTALIPPTLHRHDFGGWVAAAPFGLNTYRLCTCGLAQFRQSEKATA